MPPPKKAAKKSAKHAAKHVDLKHKQVKDLRRAFEHLGRIESLQNLLEGTSHAAASSLVSLSQKELSGGDVKNAADLLRACEHLSFAALAAGHAAQGKLSDAAMQGIEEEFEHLSRKADEHWEDGTDRHGVVAKLYSSSVRDAKRAFAGSNFRQALELIRAAEALAHVVKRGPDRLDGGGVELSLGD